MGDEALGVFNQPAGPDVKLLRGRARQLAGQATFEQYVALGAAETWDAYANNVAFANLKHHLTVFNGAGSGKIVRVRKLFGINLQTAAVTGVVVRFDAMRVTASSAGTTVTPLPHDSASAALPPQVTVRTGATVTENGLWFPWVTSSDEETAVPGLSKALFQQSVNIIPEGPEVQEYVLREGFGFSFKQVTNTAVGAYGWYCVFTCEDA